MSSFYMIMNVVERKIRKARILEGKGSHDGAEEEWQEWALASAEFNVGWWRGLGEENFGGLHGHHNTLIQACELWFTNSAYKLKFE